MDHMDSVVGAIGVLTVACRGRGGPGEVLVKIRGGSETYLASCDKPLPRGTSVLVIEELGARRVTVTALSPESEPPADDD
jgi:hypothetical protein